MTTVKYEVLEETVLNQVLPEIAAMRERDSTTNQASIRLAELERERQVKQAQIDNIVDAISGGNAPKALMQRLTILEGEIEALDLETIRQKADRGANAFKPVRSVELSIVEELRDSINSDNADSRYEARTSVNAALIRLIKRIDINPDDTFTIRPDETSWWQFDREGKMLEGEYVPA